MAAVILADTVWEGTKEDRLLITTMREGHYFKELDTGETYIYRAGAWDYVNLGLSFIKATKSGRTTTDGNGISDILFTTPIIDTDYTVALTCQDNGIQPVCGFFSGIATTGFRITTRNTRSGQPVGNIDVSWLATRNYNP